MIPHTERRHPLVSIGVPTYNRADLLQLTLDSLLAQTDKNVEIIISDNASTDGTEALCRAYADRENRIFYFRQEKNRGQMNNYSFLLQKARGKYFMWAQDDDSIDQNYVEVLTDVLEKNPEYSVALSHYYEKRVGALTPLPIRAITHDYTHKSYRELYERCLYGKISALLLYGLYRTACIKVLYARQLPLTFNNLLLWMSELVLAVKVYSVPLLLYTHTQDVRSHEARQPDGPLTLAEKRPFAITHYVATGPFWLLTSRAIPLHRKLLIFGPWIRRAWKYKRKIFNEWRCAFLNMFRRV
ncbi:MAG: hypothetical protein G01um101417_309 [Parcubacteria group bacterium Gr01-1014_17]|nr:MAG: hypothetical protein G01um101417_309 [Parcubacteria group bacterium Gr01-1014_17]